MSYPPQGIGITKIISSDQIDPGVILTSDINNAEFNVANKLVKLDGSADVPLAQIPDTLTGKDADTLDTKHYADISAEIDSDITTHAALSQNTHGAGAGETLLNTSDKNVINGVAGLNGSADVPLAQIPDTLTGKDADTLDTYHAANGASSIPILDGSGLLPQAQIPGIEKAYEISDDLLHSHDVMVSSFVNTTYALKKTITLDILVLSPSTLRIKFDICSNTDGKTVYGRIYKNGAPVGTERSTPSWNWQTYSEDIEFADNDTLELWCKMESGFSGNCRNFRVYGNESDLTLAEAITNSNVGLVDPFDATNS